MHSLMNLKNYYLFIYNKIIYNVIVLPKLVANALFLDVSFELDDDE